MKMALRMLTLAIAQERCGAAPTPSTTTVKPVERYLHILEAECDREISLINDLLDLQRLEAGEQPLTLEAIALQDWLPPRVTSFQARAQEHQQTLQLVLPLALPLFHAHAETLERILTELLTNACKYTPADGQIVVTAQAQGEAMQFRVSNTSLELSTHDLAHIFDKFYRIPKSDPWQQGGTGLGLALVQKLSEHLGGSLTVESTAGQLHFLVALPLTGEQS